MRIPYVPLFSIATVNSDTLPETTDPDFSFDYVDISSISDFNVSDSLARFTFHEAPSRARRLAKPGDIALSTVRTYLRAIAPITEHNSDSVFSTGFAIIRPKPSVCNPAFLRYATLSTDFIDAIVSHSNGVSYPAINATDVMRFRIPLPPLETQQRIANYLDRETAEIDAAVADLDKYVELLEKRRRRVVIRGFSDPKYNPVLQRLKFLTVSEDHRRIPIKSGDRVDMAGEFPYYGASGVIDYVNDYLWDNEKRLLLSEDGANLVMRNHPVAFVADGQYWVNNHAHVLKCRGETPPELVAKAIEVTSIAHLITGSAQPKLTAAAMGEIEFLFPLSVPDQKALLADLQPEMEEIDALIEESTKLRNLLLKRRSVLITEVVTGRKQV